MYFSAHWCPPCRGFTPELAQFYVKTRAMVGNDKLEIIFVSSDRDEASWKEYFAEMPWLALPYNDRARKVRLLILGYYRMSTFSRYMVNECLHAKLNCNN